MKNASLFKHFGGGTLALGLLVSPVHAQIDPSIELSSRLEDIIELGAGQFQGRLYPTAGKSISQIRSGDVDDDGDIDVIGFSDVVTIFYNSGRGTFKDVEQLPSNASYSLNDSTVSDFTGDGILDLAMFNSDGTLTSYTGLGDGNFGEPLEQNLGSDIERLLVGDINGDLKADLVGYGSGKFVPFASNGDGTFAQGEEISISTTLYRGLLLDDATGDGILDIVWSGYSEATAKILPGVGDGSFGAMVEVAITEEIRDILVADLNNDLLPDLVFSHISGGVGIAINQGAGNFAETVNIFEEFSGTTVKVDYLDIDSDGDKELVAQTVSNGLVTLKVDVLYPDGVGGYDPETIFHEQFYTFGLLSDFNGDGWMDIVCLAGTFDIYIALGREGGLYNSLGAINVSNVAAGSFRPALREHLAAGDLDENGFTDIVNQRGSVLLNQGEGAFTEVSLPYDMQVGNLIVTLGTDVALADVDNDDDQDILISVSSNRNIAADFVRVFIQDENHEFNTYSDYSTDLGPVNLEVEDLDQDGKKDVITLNRYPGGPSSVSILFGNGDGSFASPVKLPIYEQITGSQPERIAVGNTSGDGLPDILVVDRVFSGGIGHLARLFENLGGRAFESKDPQTLDAGGFMTVPAMDDFNQDGLMDILVPQNQSGEGMFTVYVSDGTGIFTQEFSLDSQPNHSYSFVTTADMDRSDGPDVLAVHSSGVDVYLSSSGGRIDEPVGYFFHPSAPSFVIAEDLNADGWPELIVEDGYEISVRPSENANADTIVFRSLRSEFRRSTEVIRIRTAFKPFESEFEQIVFHVGSESLLDRIMAWLAQFMSPAIAVLNGDDTDFVITQEMADEANEILDDIKSSASSELVDVLEAERARFDGLSEFVGMTPDEFIERLDLEEDLRILQAAFQEGTFRLEVGPSNLDEIILEKATSLIPPNWLPVNNAEKGLEEGSGFILDPSATDSNSFYRISRDE